MDLKFYLNKFLKVDNIEKYTLKTLFKLREIYDKFLESSKGVDPDFPTIDFSGKGEAVKGVNKTKVLGDDDPGDNSVFGYDNNDGPAESFTLTR